MSDSLPPHGLGSTRLSVRPHRQQPTRLPRPWNSPGKNTGEGCYFLLQCMKVKSQSEVALENDYVSTFKVTCGCVLWILYLMNYFLSNLLLIVSNFKEWFMFHRYRRTQAYPFFLLWKYDNIYSLIHMKKKSDY